MNLQRLQDIVASLRDPDTGCPWDQRQDFNTIASYTLEEAYEVIDAIHRQDYAELQGELGDLLLQVVFHAQIAAEKGYFSLADVEASICEKMTRRHPHVFGGPEQKSQDEAQVKKTWEAEKARERAEKDSHGALDGVPMVLPALKRAQKLQKRAANVGFDWDCMSGVFAKIREEIGELEQAVSEKSADNIAEEMGDVLFSCVNLVRHFKLDAEMVLMAASNKFESRFRKLETLLQAENRSTQDCSLDELESLWAKAKQEEL